jgi:hypothetical protein
MKNFVFIFFRKKALKHCANIYSKIRCFKAYYKEVELLVNGFASYQNFGAHSAIDTIFPLLIAIVNLKIKNSSF